MLLCAILIFSVVKIFIICRGSLLLTAGLLFSLKLVELVLKRAFFSNIGSLVTRY